MISSGKICSICGKGINDEKRYFCYNPYGNYSKEITDGVSTRFNSYICNVCLKRIASFLFDNKMAIRRLPTEKQKKELFKTHANCPYCGVSLRPRDRVIDHIIPIARGGNGDTNNLIPCCRKCNAEKKDMLLVEWIMALEKNAKPLIKKSPEKINLKLEMIKSFYESHYRD